MLQPPEHKWHQDTTTWRSSFSRRYWTHTTREVNPISTADRNSPLCFNWNTMRLRSSHKVVCTCLARIVEALRASCIMIIASHHSEFHAWRVRFSNVVTRAIRVLRALNLALESLYTSSQILFFFFFFYFFGSSTFRVFLMVSKLNHTYTISTGQ